jgi:glycosyltransferase involved in cell wall biosynthesis
VKGIPTLLAAAKLLHRQRPDIRFLLVGPRENEGYLAVSTREIEEHTPYVRALGARSDIPALLRLADVFVCPTELREGVPRVLLEASAAGLPIVATAVPGCADVIQDGWSGYLVPTQSPEALAERILALLQNTSSAKLFGQRASKHVRKEFSLDVTIARYASIYRALAEPSDGPPHRTRRQRCWLGWRSGIGL